MSEGEELERLRDLVSSLEAQLADANADIQDFTESSKELQEELEKELGRMEKSEREMRRGLELSHGEVSEWKDKYTAALKDHTNTMTHMQKELESLRGSEKTLRTTLRDMELDNDDLEKSEREKDSSLQDLENRYGKSIERIALLEEELVNKAHLAEEVQRLKDELRDLEGEVSVLRTQATLVPEPHQQRPLTPPGTLTHPLPQQDPLPTHPAPDAHISRTVTPPPAPPSPFSTPKQRIRSPEQPPSIELVKATPRPNPDTTPTRNTLSSPPPVPITTFRAPVSAQAAPLSRSVKAVNLSTAAAGGTPKAVRERRTDGMVKEMRDMTTRVKELTSRLDSRRNLVMAGSAIPRASMSPQGGGLTRSVTARKLTASSLGQSQLAKSAMGRPRAGSKGGDSDASSSTASLGASMLSSRPPSRSGLRMSMGGGAGKTGIPVRPPSRLSNLSTTSSHPDYSSTTSSRPTTPYTRSPTPSSATASRPPWNSSAPGSGYSTNLGLYNRRRTSSTVAPGRISPVPPMPTKPSLSSRRPMSTDSAGNLSASVVGSAPNGGVGFARRASLALGRSTLRKPSGAPIGSK